ILMLKRRMIIKTCGLREPNNITAISTLPVDWIGLIFYDKSPRYMADRADLQQYLADPSVELAKKKRVGVFVNEPFDRLLERIHDYELDYVQLHGGESAVYCETLQSLFESSSMRSAQIIKAFRVSNAFDFGITIDFEPYCSYFIFDTKGISYGGTGHKFDWDILTRYQGLTPFLLSGGIGPDDANEIKAFQHDAFVGVDLNSKFEVEPGLKDSVKLGQFLSALIK
ncbi:MAG: phosphoribosylanthranilate isomerase, partial [Bacteroidota bacterium]